MKIIINIIKKNKFELFSLLLFLFALTYFSSFFENGEIDHENPNQIHANDMFVFSGFADVVKYEVDLSKLPAFITGNHEDSLNFFSPITGIINAEISSFLNTESYNIIIHLNMLFIFFGVFSMYILLRKIHVGAALLSLPFSLLLFSWPFHFILNWGGHIGNLNIFLVLSTIIAFIYIKERFMFVILGLLNAASFLSHGREFQSFNLGVVLFFLILFFKEKGYIKIFEFEKYKNYLRKDNLFLRGKLFFYSVFISIIFIFPWWNALSGFISSNTEKGGLISWNYNPLFHQVTFSDLNIFLFLTIIGVLLSFFLIYKKNNIDFDFISIVSFFLITSGVVMFFGNNLPQARAFYLITFMPFIFIFFNVIFKLLNKKYLNYVYLLSFFILLLFVGFMGNFKEVNSNSFLFPQMDEVVKWMDINLNKTETILILSCNSCSQKGVFLPARNPYHLVSEKIYLGKINSLILTDSFIVDTFPIHHKFYINKSTGDIITGYIPKKIEKSICEYKYIYLENQNPNSNIAQYSVLLAKKLIEDNTSSIIFNNGFGVILENNIKSKNCFNDIKLGVAKDE